MFLIQYVIEQIRQTFGLCKHLMLNQTPLDDPKDLLRLSCLFGIPCTAFSNIECVQKNEKTCISNSLNERTHQIPFNSSYFHTGKINKKFSVFWMVCYDKQYCTFARFAAIRPHPGLVVGAPIILCEVHALRSI